MNSVVAISSTISVNPVHMLSDMKGQFEQSSKGGLIRRKANSDIHLRMIKAFMDTGTMLFDPLTNICS